MRPRNLNGMVAVRGKPVKVPREIALTKIMEDNMKMINDARPSQLTSFLATHWPTIAATNVRPVKKRAAQISDKNNKIAVHDLYSHLLP